MEGTVWVEKLNGEKEREREGGRECVCLCTAPYYFIHMCVCVCRVVGMCMHVTLRGVWRVIVNISEQDKLPLQKTHTEDVCNESLNPAE
jgi:hypothetical protein